MHRSEPGSSKTPATLTASAMSNTVSLLSDSTTTRTASGPAARMIGSIHGTETPPPALNQLETQRAVIISALPLRANEPRRPSVPVICGRPPRLSQSRAG